MNEKFLHYLWKFRLFNMQDLKTGQGEPLTILNTGTHNTDAGPDFFNAKIRIGETTWAGNIEMHLRSSDWIKHDHNRDKAYNNIVLHAVYEADKKIFRDDGSEIPVLELRNIIDPALWKSYDALMKSSGWVPCSRHIAQVNKVTVNAWLERLMVERLEQKTKLISKTLAATQRNWEETFYRHLARNFGFKTNSVPFEMLAASLSAAVLAKHKSSLLQIEALLFGQAGMLHKIFKDDYPNRLKKEYDFLKKKFSLQPIDAHLWKFFKLRPVNFPTIRMAQFAALVYKSKRLFSKILEIKTMRDAAKLFHVSASVYWDTHYVLDKPAEPLRKALGAASMHNLLINTVVPFLFLYGKEKGNQKLQDRALDLLTYIPAEKNLIVTNWKKHGLKAENAFHTQALIELKNQYCNLKKCLNCSIGLKILQHV
jgi:hypothetical protein